VLLVITLAETGGAQAYVASLVPALLGELDVAVVAHGSRLPARRRGRRAALFVRKQTSLEPRS
jgi:hypothetical protein